MIVIKVIYLIGPVILAGITNMVFVKLNIFSKYSRPIDNNITLKDGERLFGDNKTWKGFGGMIVFTAVYFLLWSLMYDHSVLARQLSLIDFSRYSTPFEELVYGSLWGCGYVLFELPNSFTKRRLKIDPGTNTRGLKGVFFTFVDQADSVIGCAVFLLIFFRPGVYILILFLVVGTGVHYLINILLYIMGLKKQAR